jgi:hypothetical protein
MAPTTHPQHIDPTRDIPANLRHIVDSDGDDDMRVKARILVRPVPVPLEGALLVRPTAMKVVRPIPQRVSEQFYDEVYKQGLPMDDAHTAAMVAHDWHRKWTQQDEEGHTMPHADFYAQQQCNTNTNVPDHCYLEMERQGAKNPGLMSPVDSSMTDDCPKRSLELGLPLTRVLFNPEELFRESTWSPSSLNSSLSSHMAPQVKRRFTGVVIDDDEDENSVQDFPLLRPVPQQTLAVRPVALRPTAVRINLPGVAVPKEVAVETQLDETSLTSSSDKSKNSESFMMTLLNRQNEEVHVVEAEEEDGYTTCLPPITRALSSNVSSARDGVLHALAITQGDVDSEKFKLALQPLLQYFSDLDLDTRPNLVGDKYVEGMWLALSKPNYFASLGENDQGDPMYTLGRMAFDMFSPTNLVCSLQGTFNPVEIVSEEERKAMLKFVPKSLREEVESGKTVLRTYK